MCTIFAFAVPEASAQIAAPGGINVPADQKMLLVSDELIYNNDSGIVIASGGVQIDYGGYKLVADRVEYDQNTNRMQAFGSVEMLEPTGNRIYADNLDVTDDFADGFLNALRVETPDNTRIGAESAERIQGRTTFNHGIYTACDACEKNPDRAPFWQVKAKRVIQNGETKTIRMEHARFELFGLPIAYLPYLEIPDHDKKRKTGFLTPSYDSGEKLGYGVRVPFYVAISPYMDATITGTGYTKQGFLGEAEFRQNFANGEHTLRMAGISQRDPGAFDAVPSKPTSDGLVRERGMISSTGQFRINPRWTFGWNGMLQTDNNFSRTYGIDGYAGTNIKSEVYLTGLSNRSHFDMRAFRFDIQNADENNIAEKRQAVVHPSLDYNRTFSDPIAGGELLLNVNGYSLSRKEDEIKARDGDVRDPLDPSYFSPRDADRYKGFAGANSRLSTELEWRRTLTVMNGLRLTPILAARGDVNSVDIDTAPGDYDGTFAGNGTHARGMVTAGLEASYPVLVTTRNSSHVFEPVAQIFIRPDERLAGGIPNEDAQSFVFDATSLFERDKFTGFDRSEGGTRANLGLRYSGSIGSSIKTHAAFGQSYHLAGLNSFATPDLSQATRNSGLEDDVSDFVGAAGFSIGGFSLASSARFDKDDFRNERTDVRAGLRHGRLSSSLTYSEIKAPRPYVADDEDRRELTAYGSLKVHDYWSVAASTSYDLIDKKFNRKAFALLYEDECFAFSLAYEHKRDDNNTVAQDWKIGARLSFRTLGGLGAGSVDSPLLKPSF
ncbi:LPS-assembly protein LptD [Hoeflea sp. YIM 152468]|uniref:LPS-assembly protein LptD n=1 Tax=Hoeflea sp. YIM 152468 TaxID=3031759 RepID=UPI0023DB6404|nr:LPS-assembly protein LptD [Hoeflea sp. YIM 152468]MDF1607222.1 LPS-assembly protein LptD [Hoeflea sp. YIM 152468]